MSYNDDINWSILAPGPDGIFFPTFGNYGGPNFTGGQVLAPGETPDFSVLPTSALDALFLLHDLAYFQSTDPLDRALADLMLIRGIVALPDASLSPEGHLAAGAAILGMFGNIAITNGHPELLLTPELPVYVENALHQLQSGGIAPDAGETAALQDWLEQIPTLVAGSDSVANLLGAVASVTGNLDLGALSISGSPLALSVTIQDQSERLYSSETFNFDALHQLDTKGIALDDGTRAWVDYDQSNASALSYSVLKVDASGHLAEVFGRLDDGSIGYTDLDPADPSLVSSTVYQLAGQSSVHFVNVSTSGVVTTGITTDLGALNNLLALGLLA